MRPPHVPHLLEAAEALERVPWDELPEGAGYWLGVFEHLVRSLCPECAERLKRHYRANRRKRRAADAA